jgi:large subunit ribosomal protein L34
MCISDHRFAEKPRFYYNIEELFRNQKVSSYKKSSGRSYEGDRMPKRTYQPKKRAAKREHGFFKRMASKAGVKTLKRRIAKGRSRLTK